VGWDESLFGWVWKKVHGITTRSRATGHPVVTLASLVDRLRLVALAIGGPGTRVQEAEAEGGISGHTILLPASLDLFAQPARTALLYVARTALAATAIRLDLGRIEASEPTLSSIERAVLTVLVMDEARAALSAELPAAEALLVEQGEAIVALRVFERDPLEALVREVLLGRSTSSTVLGRSGGETRLAAARRLTRALGRVAPPAPVPLWGWITPGADATSAADGDAKRGPLPRGTERTLRPRDHVTRKSLGKSRENENPLVHSFEKLHTLEEHQGGMKRVDGEDELEAHADALEELDLRELVRSDEEARSLLRSDAMFESGAGDVGDVPDPSGLRYDEWHEAERGFRAAWCRVKVEAAAEPTDRARATRDAGALARALAPRIEEVRAEILRVIEARRPRARQLDGPDVDDDALVDRHAALAARATPPDRLYVSRRRHAPELAVLVLVDLSLSTDGWVAGARVLDVEREAAFVLGEALEGLVPELGVAGFSSHTRRDCRFHVIKGMQEPWSRARPRLFALEPAGYTRIGPALRHATRTLERCAAKRRLVLLVTDGKPNDYDRYEGRHGIADVRHAVLEAASHGVHVHALAIDREARWGLARMFLDHRYTLLASPSALGPAMGRVIAAMQR
jgi:nitric oxide reductase activation protein